jgi:FMN-dependent NADH-azoreductase
VEFIYAEGLAVSPQSKETALAKAVAEITRVAANDAPPSRNAA